MTATNAHLSHCSQPGGWAATGIGQRSRFIFLLGVDSNRATGPDFHLSLHLPLLYLLGTCCSLCCSKIIPYWTCFVCLLLFIHSVLFQAEGSVLWGGGTSMFSYWFRECCSLVQDFHYVKRSCFDASFQWPFFLIGDSSKIYIYIWESLINSAVKLSADKCGRSEKQCVASIPHFWQTKRKYCVRDVCVSKSLIFKVRVCFLSCCVRSAGNVAPVSEKKQEMAMWYKTSWCAQLLLWWLCAVQNVPAQSFSRYKNPSTFFWWPYQVCPPRKHTMVA